MIFFHSQITLNSSFPSAVEDKYCQVYENSAGKLQDSFSVMEKVELVAQHYSDSEHMSAGVHPRIAESSGVENSPQ